MIRYLPTLFAAAALGAAIWWLVDLVRDRDRLDAALQAANAELAAKNAALAQAEEAARVHRVYLDRLEAEQARWAAIERDLQTMEGRDAPLSDLLRVTAERLFRE